MPQMPHISDETQLIYSARNWTQVFTLKFLFNTLHVETTLACDVIAKPLQEDILVYFAA